MLESVSDIILFFIKITFLCVHVYSHVHDERGGSFLLSRCGLWGLNSSHRAWHQNTPESPRKRGELISSRLACGHVYRRLS